MQKPCRLRIFFLKYIVTRRQIDAGSGQDFDPDIIFLRILADNQGISHSLPYSDNLIIDSLGSQTFSPDSFEFQTAFFNFTFCPDFVLKITVNSVKLQKPQFHNPLIIIPENQLPAVKNGDQAEIIKIGHRIWQINLAEMVNVINDLNQSIQGFITSYYIFGSFVF